MDNCITISGVKIRRRKSIAPAAEAAGWTEMMEVGVFEGHQMEYWLTATTRVRVWGVDSYSEPSSNNMDNESSIVGDSRYWRISSRRTKRFGSRAVLLRANSESAVKMFPPGFFDMVYLDAMHVRPWVADDLVSWWPLVRPGGVFGGHDYKHEAKWDVVGCVNLFGELMDLDVHTTSRDKCTSWFIQKPGNNEH